MTTDDVYSALQDLIIAVLETQIAKDAKLMEEQDWLDKVRRVSMDLRREWRDMQ